MNTATGHDRLQAQRTRLAHALCAAFPTPDDRRVIAERLWAVMTGNEQGDMADDRSDTLADWLRRVTDESTSVAFDDLPVTVNVTGKFVRDYGSHSFGQSFHYVDIEWTGTDVADRWWSENIIDFVNNVLHDEVESFVEMFERVATGEVSS